MKLIDGETLKVALSPLGHGDESSKFASQDTLVKVLLGVDALQPVLVTTLIERIPDFIEDNGAKYESLSLALICTERTVYPG